MADLSPIERPEPMTKQDPAPPFFSRGAAPGRLRWAESESVLAFRPARSRAALALFALLWNVYFYIWVPQPSQPIQRAVSVLALVAFALLFVRELFLVVRIRFDGDHLVVTGGPLAPWIRVSLPLVDVERVLVQRDREKGCRLEAALHAGHPVPLKISFDGPPAKGTFRKTPYFVADEEVYVFAAERINAKLEDAKHRTGPTYR